MSDTPKTDMAVQHPATMSCEAVAAIFARQLERESAAKDALIAKLQARPTEELLRIADGYIHVGNGCEIALRGTTEKLAKAEAELEELRKDKARIEWFFGQTNKGPFIEGYCRGVRDNWSVDQWRTWADAAIESEAGK